jgi:membrane associated rhomboid family serine protease
MTATELRTEAVVQTGAAGAAILSACLGCCTLGILAAIGDASKSAARSLTFWKPTGPLSGVSTLAIAIWLGAWIVLHGFWRERDCALLKVTIASSISLLVGFLLTFPPFEDLLLGK